MVCTYNPATGSTYIEIATADLPNSWLYGTGASDSFIVGLWARRDTEGSATFRSSVILQNLFTFRCSQTSWGFRPITNTAVLGTAAANQSADIYEDWCFHLAGWDKGAGIAWSCTKNSIAGRKYGSASSIVMATHTPGSLYIHKNHISGDGGGMTASAWLGHIMSVCVKKFQLSTQATIEAIVDAIYDSKDPLGLISYAGNGLNGESDSEWFALNCTIPQSPSLTVVPGATSGARYGQTITGGASTNYAWNRKGSGVTESGEWDVARPVTVAGSMVFTDHETVDADFFLRPPPGNQTDGINSVNAPFAKRLHDNTPSGVERICVWSNSRGTRPVWYAAGPSQPEWANWAGNHALGFTAHRQAKSLGVFASGFRVSDIRRFGHDCPAAPYSSATRFLGSISGWRDFTMFWTGSAFSDSTQGPGSGLILDDVGSLVSMKARKSAGSYLDGIQGSAWKHTFYYLKFPGCAHTLSYQVENSTAQDTAGTLEGLSALVDSLDTTEVTWSFTVSDTYLTSPLSLELNGAGLGIEVGWSVVITSGTGQGSVSYVTDVIDGTPTILTLSHQFHVAPVAGSSQFKIGPVSVGSKSVTSSGLPANEYQGLRITHQGPAGTSAILLGVDVQVMGIADGWMWAAAGWGGNGYQPQMTQSAPGAIASYLTQTGVTGLLMFNATQSTTTTQRDTFAGLAAAAIGGVEKLVICCDQDHRTDSQTETWGVASLAQSVYPAAVGTESDWIGSNSIQFATGQAQNGAHPSIEGMYYLAQAYLGDGVTAGQFDGFEDIDPIAVTQRKARLRFNERPWRGRPA
jgi:hypothetical protein